MTIALSANTPRVSYTVNQGATQTSFAVPFVFFEKSTDLNVFVDNVARTYDASTSNTSLFTVTGGNGATGTVTTSVTGASGGSTVIITRSIPLQRTTDFPSGGAFEIAKLNTELDTLLTMITDADDENSRALRLQDSDDAVSLTLPLKDARKGTVLGFNATTGAAEAGPTIANVNALSAITANINTVAGISGNVTTVANNDSNITTVAGNDSNITIVAGINSAVTTVAQNITDINNAASNATVAQNYAIKVDGVVPNTSDYSSKAHAIGGTGIDNGVGASKQWAIGGGSTPSATTVVGNTSDYSAKGYAIGAINRGSAGGGKHSAKDWATYVDGSNTVDGTYFSARYYAELAESYVDSFDDTYLGAKSSNPTTDNDGDALTTGDLYFNTTSNIMRVWNGSQWNDVAIDSTSFASKGFATAMAVAL